jgi:hypothetical protein
MKNKIQITRFTFETKAKATAFMQAFVASRKGQMPIEEFDLFLRKNEDFEFLMALLRRHPHADNKIGCGIKTFEIVKTVYNNWGLQLTRVDGSKTDFSWRECLKATPEDSAMKGAMRKAVDYQIMNWVKSHTHKGQLCCLCNEKPAEHVDHVPPNTFETIAESFISGLGDLEKGPVFDDLPSAYGGKNTGKNLEKGPVFDDLPSVYGGKNCGLDPQKQALFGLVLHKNVIDTYSVDGQMGRKILDPVIEKEWQDFHENQAVLRYLCVFCNLSTSKKEHNASKRAGHTDTQN